LPQDHPVRRIFLLSYFLYYLKLVCNIDFRKKVDGHRLSTLLFKSLEQ